MFSFKRIVKHVILSYFLIGFQKEFSYERSLDRADALPYKDYMDNLLVSIPPMYF